MLRFKILGAAILGMAGLLWYYSEVANAGRVGGPASEVQTVAALRSAFFNIPFQAGSPAEVTVSGNGASALMVLMYDADNHMAVGVGIGDQKVVTMNVYRTGTFRIEVRNLGSVANTFVISTN